MSIEQTLKQRSQDCCELCSKSDELAAAAVEPKQNNDADSYILLCQTCREQIDNSSAVDVNHWRCLNEAMWSQVPAVQVMAWRQLKYLSTETWAQDLLDMLYLEEDIMAWAQASEDSEQDDTVPTLDSNGSPLVAGDTVTVIKDLDVKGAGFTAKRGTAVRGISLTNNPKHIEGRVNGVRIVLLTQYLKKSN